MIGYFFAKGGGVKLIFFQAMKCNEGDHDHQDQVNVPGNDIRPGHPKKMSLAMFIRPGHLFDCLG